MITKEMSLLFDSWVIPSLDNMSLAQALIQVGTSWFMANDGTAMFVSTKFLLLKSMFVLVKQ